MEIKRLNVTENAISIIFDHKYSSIDDPRVNRALSIVQIKLNQELPLFLKVLQAWHPSEIKTLVAGLQEKLEKGNFSDSQKRVLEFAIYKLSALSEARLILIVKKESQSWIH